MKTDNRCPEAADISALLDSELSPDEAAKTERHIAGCRRCAGEYERVASVRRALRIEVAEPGPDVTAAVIERLTRGDVKRSFRPFLRTAFAAALVGAVVAGGLTPAFLRRGEPQVAGATEISQGVRAAARQLDTYSAVFSVIERGGHPGVEERRLTVSLAVRAPDGLRITVRDLTDYPSRESGLGDAELITSARGTWIEESLDCPPEAAFICPVDARRRRLIQDPPPFDTGVPPATDAVLPIETLGDGATFEVLGRGSVAGRAAFHIATEHRRAVPVVGALQAVGLWRPFHPLDRVELWLDQETWIPLRIRITAGDSAGRAAWAAGAGVDDRSGDVLLDAIARNMAESVPNDIFSLPAARGSVAAIDAGFVADGRFRIPDAELPARPLGLEPHSAGTSAAGHRIVAYASGLEWLRITSLPPREVTGLDAEEIRLDEGTAYYTPAGPDLIRRVDVYHPDGHLRLESNVPRADLIGLAASLGLDARPLPRTTQIGGGVTIERLDTQDPYGRFTFASPPGVLPKGYEPGRPTVATLVRSPSGPALVTRYLGREAEFDGIGVRFTQAPRASGLLPPSAGSFETVSVDGATARWSADRGELEWISDGVYRAITAPSFDLGVVLRIAKGLR